MRRIVFALAVIAVTPGLADEKEKERKVRELLKLTGDAAIGWETIVEVLSERSIFATEEAVRAQLRRTVKLDEFVDRIVPIYMKRLDDKTLDAAIAFYKTPEGRNLRFTRPGLVASSRMAARTWAHGVVDTAVQALRKHQLTPVTLPVASSGVPDKGGSEARVILTLDGNGRITHEGRSHSIDEVGSALDSKNRLHDAIKRRKGLSGYEQLPGGGRASTLHVLIRADRDAPWLHVAWLMTIMAEQRMYKLHFGVKLTADRAYSEREAAALGAKRMDVAPPAQPRFEGEFKAFLPTDSGVRDPKVSVLIVAQEEKRVLWGPAGSREPVSVPTTVVYRVGKRESQSLDDVAKWIDQAQKVAVDMGIPLAGEIKARNRVPFKYVVAVLNRLRKGGVRRIDFFGVAIPNSRFRRRATLPYPSAN